MFNGVLCISTRPPLSRRSTKSEILETALKLSITLAMERGGKAGLFGGAVLVRPYASLKWFITWWPIRKASASFCGIGDVAAKVKSYYSRNEEAGVCRICWWYSAKWMNTQAVGSVLGHAALNDGWVFQGWRASWCAAVYDKHFSLCSKLAWRYPVWWAKYPSR